MILCPTRTNDHAALCLSPCGADFVWSIPSESWYCTGHLLGIRMRCHLPMAYVCKMDHLFFDVRFGYCVVTHFVVCTSSIPLAVVSTVTGGVCGGDARQNLRIVLAYLRLKPKAIKLMYPPRVKAVAPLPAPCSLPSFIHTRPPHIVSGMLVDGTIESATVPWHARDRTGRHIKIERNQCWP